MIWILMHTAISVLLILTALFMMWRWGAQKNLAERLGLALVSGCGFLRINVIWERHDSPYDYWAPTLLSLGLLLVLTGRGYRDWRHESRNISAIKQARAHLQARGKL